MGGGVQGVPGLASWPSWSDSAEGCGRGWRWPRVASEPLLSSRRGCFPRCPFRILFPLLSELREALKFSVLLFSLIFHVEEQKVCLILGFPPPSVFLLCGQASWLYHCHICLQMWWRPRLITLGENRLPYELLR